jgi:hypothetical protein
MTNKQVTCCRRGAQELFLVDVLVDVLQNRYRYTFLCPNNPNYKLFFCTLARGILMRRKPFGSTGIKGIFFD